MSVSGGAKIIKDSIRRFASHNCLALSASISFYAMFSFFPLLLLVLSIFATVAGSSAVAMSRINSLVSNLTPAGSSVVMGWVKSIAETKPIAWGMGLVGVIWGARHVFYTLALSASIIWGKKGWKDVILRQVVALVLVGIAALLLLASLVIPGFVESMRTRGGMGVSHPLRLVLILVPYFFSFVTFSVIYLLTSPGRVAKRNILIGAALVSLTWEIAKNAFLAYIRMTKITSAYGSIGGIIVLMAWIYCSSAIVLWGMELIAAWHREPAETPHLRRKKGLVIIE